MKNIIIIGSRGYKFNYGGWETFVTNLVLNTHEKDVQYYIPNLTHEKKEDKKIKEIDGVISPSLYVPKQGFVTMFTFTIKTIRYFLKYIREKNLENTVMIVLGCKVGPLFPLWKRKLKKYHVPLIINPDGLEWKRDKWSWWIKKCFKISERFSVKYSDYVICDSKAIQDYIDSEYKKYQIPSGFIAYGAYENQKPKKNEVVKKLWKEYDIKDNDYYLIVGRFVPENNYETMIKEFMKTHIKKDLVIICNLEKNKFYEYLQEETGFEKDKRIKFIGSVYDPEALLYFRQHAYAYLHGHSAGGTNPSLLEALANTSLNILFDVSYNREVGEDCCFYFSKEKDQLKKVLENVDGLDKKKVQELEKKAKARIHEAYTWTIVVDKYLEVVNQLLDSRK